MASRRSDARRVALLAAAAGTFTTYRILVAQAVGYSLLASPSRARLGIRVPLAGAR